MSRFFLSLFSPMYCLKDHLLAFFIKLNSLCAIAPQMSMFALAPTFLTPKLNFCEGCAHVVKNVISIRSAMGGFKNVQEDFLYKLKLQRTHCHK